MQSTLFDDTVQLVFAVPWFSELETSGVVGKWVPVGSRVTCNPPPTDTDADVLVLCSDTAKFEEHAKAGGFVRGGSASYQNPAGIGKFASYKAGDGCQSVLNFIVTEDYNFFAKFVLATKVCATLNLLGRPDRLVVFKAMLYGQCKHPVGSYVGLH